MQKKLKLQLPLAFCDQHWTKAWCLGGTFFLCSQGLTIKLTANTFFYMLVHVWPRLKYVTIQSFLRVFQKTEKMLLDAPSYHFRYDSFQILILKCVFIEKARFFIHDFHSFTFNNHSEAQIIIFDNILP